MDFISDRTQPDKLILISGLNSIDLLNVCKIIMFAQFGSRKHTFRHVPSEVSDQLAHSLNLMRTLTGSRMQSFSWWQQRLWLDYVDA